MRPLIFICAIATMCFSCKKDKILTGEKIEIFLLRSYQMVSTKCQVNSAGSVLQDTPIVKNQDILKYFKAEHQFALTVSSLQKLKSLNDGTPFALTIDKQVIYYGILKPSYSNSTCANSITMDYIGTYDKITMNLGYPGTDINIDDQRNNSKLIATLKNQGKLK